MMVRDEEELLAPALESAGLACDELIVVDTGSKDRTIEIARAHGAKVFEFQWCDDFSAARNETLRHAIGDWILILDADERLRGPNAARLRASLPAPTGHPFQVFMLDVINVRADGGVISSAYGVRIVPNDRRLGYRGRVHNNFCALDPAFPEIRASHLEGVEILHLGYDPELYARRRKAERSLPLLEATVRDEPDNLAQRYYLGREYLRLARLEEAIGALEHVVANLGRATRGERDAVEQAAWRDLVEAKRAAGRPLPEVLSTAIAALGQHPHNPDLWFGTARALAHHGAHDKSIEYYLRALKCVEHGQAQQWMGIAHRPWEIVERLAEAHGASGRLEDAYRAYREAMSIRPIDAPGWTALLHSLVGLAVDLDDRAALPALLERLLGYPDAAMELVELAQRKLDPAELAALKAKHPRAS